jgi:hypothetical protein
VYAAVLGAWSYLVAWGALGAASVAHAQQTGGVIGAVVALAAGLALLGRREEEPARAGSSAVTTSGS